MSCRASSNEEVYQSLRSWRSLREQGLLVESSMLLPLRRRGREGEHELSGKLE